MTRGQNIKKKKKSEQNRNRFPFPFCPHGSESKGKEGAWTGNKLSRSFQGMTSAEKEMNVVQVRNRGGSGRERMKKNYVWQQMVRPAGPDNICRCHFTLDGAMVSFIETPEYNRHSSSSRSTSIKAVRTQANYHLWALVSFICKMGVIAPPCWARVGIT